MNITDELREYAHDCCARVDDAIHAIADRIDAEHKKACDDAWDNGYEADYLGIEKWLTEHPQVMGHHGWVQLPKDADGEYIHVGDVMEERSGHTFEVASLMAFGGSENWLALSDPRNFSSFREPHDIRHHHAPTVEDVLREFADEVYADADNEIRDRDFLCAKYAKRLTLAEEEDA